MSKTLTHKDFIDLLKFFSKYFNMEIPNKNQSKNIENITLKRVGMKHIYIPYINSKSEEEIFEIWINESIHYETEYVLFYYEENEDRLSKIRKNYFLKDLSQELNKKAIHAYELLSSLKIVKIKNF